MMPQSPLRHDHEDQTTGFAASLPAEQGHDAAPTGSPPPVLRKRAEFLRAASARRQGMPGFLLQARRRGDDDPFRVGYTCSRKLGNAVTRNRAKRRLRAVARAVMPQSGRAGWDYVLVGRPGVTVTRDFAALCEDLRLALARVHAPRRSRKEGRT